MQFRLYTVPPVKSSLGESDNATGNGGSWWSSSHGIRAIISGVDFRHSDVHGSDSENIDLSTDVFRRQHNTDIWANTKRTGWVRRYTGIISAHKIHDHEQQDSKAYNRLIGCFSFQVLKQFELYGLKARCSWWNTANATRNDWPGLQWFLIQVWIRLGLTVTSKIIHIVKYASIVELSVLQWPKIQLECDTESNGE